MPEMCLRQGLRPWPRRGELTALPRPLAWFKGPHTSKQRGGQESKEIGRGQEGKTGRGNDEGKGAYRYFCFPTLSTATHVFITTWPAQYSIARAVLLWVVSVCVSGCWSVNYDNSWTVRDIITKFQGIIPWSKGRPSSLVNLRRCSVNCHQT